MKLTAILTAAALTLTMSAAARAETYTDGDANFKLTVPTGWQTTKVTNQSVKLMMVKAADKEHVGICIVVTQLHAETKGVTQAQLDAQFEPLIDEKFWQFIITMSPGLEDASVKSSRTDVRNGRNVYTAVMAIKLKDKSGQNAVDATAKEIMLVIPGQFYFVTCIAPDTGYETMEGDFDTVLNSFGPVSDTPVASLETPGVSALTLYSGAKFGGVSRVVTQDTPDLTLFGWSKPAGSVSVAGSAPWEMCSGANYSGKCQVVSGSFASSLANGGTVLSARRVQPTGASLVRALQSDAAHALTEAAARAR